MRSIKQNDEEISEVSQDTKWYGYKGEKAPMVILIAKYLPSSKVSFII